VNSVTRYRISKLRPDDVLHYKAYSEDGLEGISVLKRTSMTLATARAAQKYQPTSMNNSDAQFVESNEVRVADVCRFFSVPLHLVYAGKQSYQSNEQNSIEYVNYTLA